MGYEFYLTDKGTELLGQLVVGQKVAITKVCFGSGATVNDRPDYTITELKHSETEKILDPDTDSAMLDPNDNSVVCLTSELPGDYTGTINEIGYKDDSGNLIFYGNVPEEVITAHPSRSYKYTNWIAFENQEIDKIEFGVMSPDFERVERLVEQIEEEFDPNQFGLKVDVERNTQNIEKNAKSIESNTASITENTSSIAENAKNIATNTGNISTNTTNITSLQGSVSSLQTGKVDKVDGKDLVSTSDITQITTNKNNIATNKSAITTNANNITSLQSGKVDKVSGKDLVSTTDITQITTNKNNISSLTTRVATLETTLSGVEALVSSINARLEAIV